MLVQKQEVTEIFVSCSTFQAVFCLKYKYLYKNIYRHLGKPKLFCAAIKHKKKHNIT